MLLDTTVHQDVLFKQALNPIEQAFAKLKALLRKVGERTRDGLWNAIGQILKLYSPDECRNLFRNLGYSTWSVTALAVGIALHAGGNYPATLELFPPSTRHTGHAIG